MKIEYTILFSKTPILFLFWIYCYLMKMHTKVNAFIKYLWPEICVKIRSVLALLLIHSFSRQLFNPHYMADIVNITYLLISAPLNIMM